MHIYFSGIGGSGLSAMAQFCLDLGFKVSGSDMEKNENTDILIARGVNICIPQLEVNISKVHSEKKIDWFVYTPSVNSKNVEFQFAKVMGIKMSKQNELLNYTLKEKELKMIAVAGTHGKTTTTGMAVWLFEKLNIPVSYVVGTNLPFGPSGKYTAGSEYFVYEADEYDKKFLELSPEFSIITSLDFDHPDTYTSQEDYFNGFNQFISQTKNNTFLWRDDFDKLDSDILVLQDKEQNAKVNIFEKNKGITIKLSGLHNRQNGFLAAQAVSKATNLKVLNLYNFLTDFPGTQRRMEKLSSLIYSDYAHHPVEIEATIQMAKEMMVLQGIDEKKLIVVYQPHQNIRQHEIQSGYVKCFDMADEVYWLPTFLTREKEDLSVLTPADLIKNISPEDRQKIRISDLGVELIEDLKQEMENGNLVLVMGAGTIDKWAREGLV